MRENFEKAIQAPGLLMLLEGPVGDVQYKDLGCGPHLLFCSVSHFAEAKLNLFTLCDLPEATSPPQTPYSF